MTSILPPIPRLVFTILEPLSLIAGAVMPLIDPADFVTSQVPNIVSHRLYETEHVLALQMGNLYFLLCMVGVFVLNTTTEARVVHAYILACLIADVGHVAASASVLGYQATVDVKNWNAMAWGNIGITAILFALRTLYLLGYLGQDRVPARRAKKNI